MNTAQSQRRMGTWGGTGIGGRIVENGWVALGANPTDGRAASVEITEEARSVLDARRKEKAAWLADLIADLFTGERKTLEQALVI